MVSFLFCFLRLCRRVLPKKAAAPACRSGPAPPFPFSRPRRNSRLRPGNRIIPSSLPGGKPFLKSGKILCPAAQQEPVPNWDGLLLRCGILSGKGFHGKDPRLGACSPPAAKPNESRHTAPRLKVGDTAFPSAKAFVHLLSMHPDKHCMGKKKVIMVKTYVDKKTI